MTEIGEGVSIGSGPDSDGDDLDDNHWLELEYLYQSGAPVYGTFRATDSDGMLWTGRLNDQGKVCLAGLPAGTVEVDLLPETNTDDDIQATRQAIKRVLDQIIEDQKDEAAEYERDLENLGGPRRVYEHIHKLGATVWKHGVGVIEFLGTAAHKTIQVSNFLHPLNLLGDNLKAGYKSYQDGELDREQWYDSVNQNLRDEHKKDVARILGIEPDDLSEERFKELMALITEAYDIAAFIADDAKTREMLKQFVKELAETQHSMEWAGFAGAGVFELVLAALLVMFTGGAGLAAQAGTKLRHTAELRSLGPLFRKLAEQLRQKKLNKQVDVEVDQPTTTKTDQPELITLEPAGGHSRSERASGTSHSVESPRPREKISALSEADQEKVATAATFKTKGVSEDEALDYLDSEEGGEYISLLKESDSGADELTIMDRAVGQIQTGKELPRKVTVEEPLVKLVPSGSEVSPYSPFFTTKEELAEAKASGRTLSDYFGLPASSDSAAYDILEISPKPNATAFESEVAPTVELDGIFTTDGGGKQLVVPNRGQFENPRKVGSMLDN